MGRLVLIDGEVYAPAEAKISVYDRAFLYGDSVFETIRTYGGRLFALDEHIDRLAESAAKIGLGLPVSPDVLEAETRFGVEEAQNPETYARVVLTRGSGPLGLDPTLGAVPRRVILIEPLQMPPPSYYRDGIEARTIQTVRASDAVHSAKLSNYLASALALRSAREAGAEEALVVNREGQVVEGPTSNLFVVKGGKLITPPLDAGILAGITRARVLGLAEEQGIGIEYRAMTVAELQAADELFLSSTIRELVPVVKVDGVVLGDGKPGEITRLLHRSLRRRVGLDGRLPHEG
jgi:branched-chain amino acid aminotransferase